MDLNKTTVVEEKNGTHKLNIAPLTYAMLKGNLIELLQGNFYDLARGYSSDGAITEIVLYKTEEGLASTVLVEHGATRAITLQYKKGEKIEVKENTKGM